MGLLRDASRVIRDHLQSRGHNQNLKMEYRDLWERKWPELLAVRKQLEALNPTNHADRQQWPAPVGGCIALSSCQASEGTIEWREHWYYPSAALLQQKIGFGLYGLNVPGFPPGPIHDYEGALQVRVAAKEQELIIDIPLGAPWGEPRIVLQYLKRIAPPSWGRLTREMEEAFFRDFRVYMPGDGPRLWRLLFEPRAPLADILGSLVIVAEKQGFPVSEDDERSAMKWLHPRHEAAWAADGARTIR